MCGALASVANSIDSDCFFQCADLGCEAVCGGFSGGLVGELVALQVAVGACVDQKAEAAVFQADLGAEES